MKQLEKNGQLPALQAISELAARHSIGIWATGSFVRRLLLDEDASEVSLICDAEPLEFAELISTVLPESTVQTDERPGNVRVKHRLGLVKLIALSGSDASETIETHLNRRDFTINAIALDLSVAQFGKLVDPTGGQKNLQDGVVCCTGDPGLQFSRYPLRMLKAIVLAARLDYEIDSATFAGIASNAASIGRVPPQRVTAEFRKLMLVDRPSSGLELLLKSGLSAQMFPELDKMTGIEQREEYQHKDVFYHTLQVVDNISRHTDRFELRFAALMHDIAKPQTKRFVKGVGWTFHGHEELGARMTLRIGRRMRLSPETIDYVAKLVRLHLRPIPLVGSSVTDSAVRRLMTEAGEQIDDLMMLCRADITSKNFRKVERYLANFDHVEERMAAVREKDRLREFQPAITGEQIMRALNIPAGPVVGKIKTAIREAVLGGEIPNEPDACIAHMHAIKDRFI